MLSLRADSRFLWFFDRFERFKHQIVLTGATGARFEMLSHAEKDAGERRFVVNALNVFIQFIKAFRTSEFHFSRLSDHL
jgi:hypothetical protein